MLRQHPFAGWSIAIGPSWGVSSLLGTTQRRRTKAYDHPAIRLTSLLSEDVGPDLIHFIPGSLWRSWTKARWRSRMQGVPQAGVIHLLPDAVVQVLHQQLLGSSSMPGHSASTLTPRGLSSRGRSSILIKEKEHYDPLCSLGKSTLGPFYARLCVWAESDLPGRT